jgi:DNA-binding response OmpR family regulator
MLGGLPGATTRHPLVETKTILVCDDDPLLVDLLSFRLAAKGFAIVTASDGAEALEMLEKSALDAIILDAMMPVVDGFEVLRQIRESPQTADIPVLMLTARQQENDIVGAFELGANDYMIKPFIPEELVARLSGLLSGSTR